MPPKVSKEYASQHPYTAAEFPYKSNPITGTRIANPYTQSSSNTSSKPFPPARRRIEAVGSEDIRQSAPSPTRTTQNDSNDSSSNTPASASTSSNTVSSRSTVYSSSKSSPNLAANPAPTPPSAPSASDFPRAQSSSSQSQHSHFETLLADAQLPEPGLAYYMARRALWHDQPPVPPTPSSPSPSRVKLEALLNQPGAVESEEVWKAGLKNVWKGLVGGNQLRKRLPLSIVLKILQAGWLRDGTWPEGSVAPSWEENAPSSIGPSTSSQAQGTGSQGQQRHELSAPQPVFSPGIPAGYSPSSGDQPEQYHYSQPYQYAQPTPPPVDEEARPPPPSSQPHRGYQQVDDDEEEPEEEEEEEAAGLRAGDGRHEGG